MKKIIITGGLGYLATEICKLYSGTTRFNKITVIDNKFYSEKVKQLRDWGMEFIQASILDEKVMEEQLKDADVIIHLAGITDVAYVKTQSNKEHDEQIKQVGITGTQNIIKYSKSDCKIVFPSSHVIFEGFEKTKLDIDENEKPCPVLTYAIGKAESEKDIMESGKNYVILRLASVYGYSGDAMRTGIMPNLFSKIASQNGQIKLFSGGVQLKNLVPLIDVARCFKFMADNDQIQKEVFNLSKDTITVKQVAEICKKINPNLTIVETKDEIPNLGYTLSNKKLLATGFEFHYNLEDSIKEMIQNWSRKLLPSELEYKICGQKEFIDARGRISNYELPEPINMIGLIESKASAVRANHYHPIQEQKCLLIKGRYVSVTKDLSNPDCKIETKVINAGEISVIKPNVAHAMVFLEDSTFLNLVRGEREHENYGKTHTIPYPLVDENFAYDILYDYITGCRVCGNEKMKRVVSLGKLPLANNLIDSPDQRIETFPLEMDYCDSCHNCQLSFVVPPEKMFDNYLYVSSTSESFRKHFSDAADKYIQEFKLTPNTLVIDIGSNDGIFLKPLKEKGIRILGVEPAKNIAQIANNNGIFTLNDYFSNVTTKIIAEFGKARVITASNVFAHANDLVDITKRVFHALEQDGAFIIEVQYLFDTLNDLTFDNIYHEHLNYWSVTSIVEFFKRVGGQVYKIEHINTHGGSIRVYVNRGGAIHPSVESFMAKEREFGLHNYDTYKRFGNKISEIRENVIQNIVELKKNYKRISAYGAPAKATTALNYFGINNSHIDYIIEDNPLKIDKFVPGVNIPIKSKQYCMENLPDVIIVMAWNFFEQIKQANQDLIDKGVKFINIKELQDEKFEI